MRPQTRSPLMRLEGAVLLDARDRFEPVGRVLETGGRFAVTEPWRAALYGIGTSILGKREVQVGCRPLTATRLRSLPTVFRRSQIRHHGALTGTSLLRSTSSG